MTTARGSRTTSNRARGTARRCWRSCRDWPIAKRRRGLSGADIGVPRAALPAAGENEFYWADLVGLAVVNRQGVMLGNVAAVEDFGAHPILRVAGDDGCAAAHPVRRRVRRRRCDGANGASTSTGSRITEERHDRGAVRIDVVTLFPGHGGAGGRRGRDGTGAGARAVASRGVESARFRDGQPQDRRRPAVRRRTGDGDAGRAARASDRRREGGAARGRCRGAAGDPPVAGRSAADARAGDGAGDGARARATCCWRGGTKASTSGWSRARSTRKWRSAISSCREANCRR